jgi:hypothetical protein
MLKDAVEMATRELIPAEPEPVNPFAPRRTPQEWADAIKALIAEADADGARLWVDVADYFGPGPYVRIGSPGNPMWENDTILWEQK